MASRLSNWWTARIASAGWASRKDGGRDVTLTVILSDSDTTPKCHQGRYVLVTMTAAEARKLANSLINNATKAEGN